MRALDLVWAINRHGLLRIGDTVTRGDGVTRYRVAHWWVDTFTGDILAELVCLNAARVCLAGTPYRVTVPLDDLHVRVARP